jgi:hypothetical protein
MLLLLEVEAMGWHKIYAPYVLSEMALNFYN